MKHPANRITKVTQVTKGITFLVQLILLTTTVVYRYDSYTSIFIFMAAAFTSLIFMACTVFRSQLNDEDLFFRKVLVGISILCFSGSVIAFIKGFADVSYNISVSIILMQACLMVFQFALAIKVETEESNPIDSKPKAEK